jgi:DNA (cytosine-5)-methyltransferase 1
MGKRLDGSNVVCININNYNPLLDEIDFIIGGSPCQTFFEAGAGSAGGDGLTSFGRTTLF